MNILYKNKFKKFGVKYYVINIIRTPQIEYEFNYHSH